SYSSSPRAAGPVVGTFSAWARATSVTASAASSAARRLRSRPGAVWGIAAARYDAARKNTRGRRRPGENRCGSVASHQRVEIAGAERYRALRARAEKVPGRLVGRVVRGLGNCAAGTQPAHAEPLERRRGGQPGPRQHVQRDRHLGDELRDVALLDQTGNED